MPANFDELAETEGRLPRALVRCPSHAEDKFGQSGLIHTPVSSLGERLHHSLINLSKMKYLKWSPVLIYIALQTSVPKYSVDFDLPVVFDMMGHIRGGVGNKLREYDLRADKIAATKFYNAKHVPRYPRKPVSSLFKANTTAGGLGLLFTRTSRSRDAGRSR
ncbi:MAG: hypothetical protein M1818_000347 [Claussenomyces sp. TS43310]|nr:MAG: hypothetical protein M1818_000347 [Claussenomyces sp. TS43310]